MNINIKPISEFVKGVKDKVDQFIKWNDQKKFQDARNKGLSEGANNNLNL